MTATPPPERAVEEALAGGERCVVAVRGACWPVLKPTVFWADGAGIWMTAPARSAEVVALRREPACALWIAPPAGDRRDGARGAVVSGRARVFGLEDPVGLTFHGPMISTAMASLAVKQAGAMLGFAQDAAQAVPRLALRRQVVIRVAIEQIEAAARPLAGPGIAPALPVAVPADVRRAIAGERRVVVATQGPSGLTVRPALWGAGFHLDAGPDAPDTGPAAVAVETPASRRPTQAVGLVLSGAVAAGGAFEPAEATWWRGFEVASSRVSSAAGVTLPD